MAQRVNTEGNISGSPPEYLPFSGLHLLFDERAELRLVQLLSTLLQRSLSNLWG